MNNIYLTTGQQERSGRPRRGCIIGAGVSGLVAAKVFLARRYEVVVVEQGAEIGGVWAPAPSYPGVRTQTPRALYCSSDFPMPSTYSEWPTGEQVYQYLRSYAAHFGHLPLIRVMQNARMSLRGQMENGHEQGEELNEYGSSSLPEPSFPTRRRGAFSTQLNSSGGRKEG